MRQSKRAAQRQQLADTIGRIRTRIAALEARVAEPARKAARLTQTASEQWLLTDLAGNWEVGVVLGGAPSGPPCATVVVTDPRFPQLELLTSLSLTKARADAPGPGSGDGWSAVYAYPLNAPDAVAADPSATGRPYLFCALTSGRLRSGTLAQRPVPTPPSVPARPAPVTAPVVADAADAVDDVLLRELAKLDGAPTTPGSTDGPTFDPRPPAPPTQPSVPPGDPGGFELRA